MREIDGDNTYPEAKVKASSLISVKKLKKFVLRKTRPLHPGAAPGDFAVRMYFEGRLLRNTQVLDEFHRAWSHHLASSPAMNIVGGTSLSSSLHSPPSPTDHAERSGTKKILSLEYELVEHHHEHP